jgi:hypothetical protein
MSSDWMPGKRPEQLALAKTWCAQLPVAGGAWNVTASEVTELALLIEEVEHLMGLAEADRGSAFANARVKEGYDTLVRAMRLMHRRKFFSPPMQDSDWIRLGLKPPDTIRTTHFEVSEFVEFELKLREIREVIVNFWVKGSPHKAKPNGYDGAVFIWDVLDAPPAEPISLTRHAMASRTPHSLKFTEEERGRTVYIAAAWQNERGITGDWSGIQSAVIP